MSSVEEHLKKSREERLLREKARLEKLRELNVKKYNHPNGSTIPMKPSAIPPSTTKKKTTNEALDNIKRLLHATFKKAKTEVDGDENTSKESKRAENNSKILKPDKCAEIPELDSSVMQNIKLKRKQIVNEVQETLSAKKTNKRVSRLPIVEQAKSRKSLAFIQERPVANTTINKSVPSKSESAIKRNELLVPKVQNMYGGRKSMMPNNRGVLSAPKQTSSPKHDIKISANKSTNISKLPLVQNNALNKQEKVQNVRKSMMPSVKPNENKRFSVMPKVQKNTSLQTNALMQTRKSIIPKMPQLHDPKDAIGKKESVFDRLYKPKVQNKERNIDSKDITNKKSTVKVNFTQKPKSTAIETKPNTEPVRRSISAVHFKRISRSELPKCIQRWSSIGENLDKAHLKERYEDENIKGDIVVSAVKSDRKKVTFKTPLSINYNTPSAEELRSRLTNWLQKRGKALDSYHHLQCFGVHHLVQSRVVKPLIFNNKEQFDEENKENVALESDSDNQSYEELMNSDEKVTEISKNDDGKWRRASFKSDSTDLNETKNSSVNSEVVLHHVDELLSGALNDLTELLKEGFDWEQCARWLRAIRDRFPHAPDSAAYWECRAALEERRGDLPASMECWGEAIAKGTKHTIVEENLDQLLDKFMQLKISPNEGKKKPADPKLVDVKNVFKSTIIRFAVQQAKLRQSAQETPKFTVTPVRRSARLSTHSAKRTPLQICTSVRQANALGGQMVFVPNSTLCQTP